ncbi:TPA: DUF1295 domain-containing protein [Vibrio vulnificus]|nr:DUF1295 domain-containing protein [Vibrio vulnificus]
MDKLELKVPPVAVFLLVMLVMYLISMSLPSLTFTIVGYQWFAGALFAVSGVVGISGVLEFRRAKTTVNPIKPESASSVVSSGIFRYSRNPMYLALLLLLLAYALWLQNGLAFVGCPLFVIYMNRFQIRPEERALERLFGPTFLDYKSQVRRWF